MNSIKDNPISVKIINSLHPADYLNLIAINQVNLINQFFIFFPEKRIPRNPTEF